MTDGSGVQRVADIEARLAAALEAGMNRKLTIRTMTRPDEVFLAHAPEDIRYLLDALKKEREINTRLRSAHDY